ncbi:MAG: hypothetical protein RL196_1012 [Actinomycetota bacterium]|jgi:hypothetical protein
MANEINPDVWLEASKQVASKLGITYENGDLSLSRGSIVKSMGGWLGIAESILPTLVFVFTYQLSGNIWLSIAISGSLSLAALVRQLIVRSALAQAVVGALSIALTIWLTLKDNNASDFFLQGLITNSIYLAVGLISILMRWPIIGIIVGFLIGEGFTWRKRRAHFNRFVAATAIWCGLYILRLGIEVPLYLSQNLSALGAAKLILGIPFYAITLWLIWLVVKPLIRRAS